MGSGEAGALGCAPKDPPMSTNEPSRRASMAIEPDGTFRLSHAHGWLEIGPNGSLRLGAAGHGPNEVSTIEKGVAGASPGVVPCRAVHSSGEPCCKGRGHRDAHEGYDDRGNPVAWAEVSPGAPAA